MGSKHDAYFQNSLKYKKISIPLLKKELPESISRRMDFTRIEAVDSSYITDQLDHKVSDVVFKVPYKGEGSYILILMEHQSTPDGLMAFRLFLYIFLLVQRIHREYEAERKAKAAEGICLPVRKLPVVFPMIFYNGRLTFQNKTLAECFEDPELFSEIINTKPLLVHAIDDKPSAEDNAWYLVFRRLMGYIQDKELRRILLDLEQQMLQIDNEGKLGADFLVSSLYYLSKSARYIERENILGIVDKLSRSGGDFVTVIEQIKEDVRRETSERVSREVSERVRREVSEHFKREMSQKELADKQRTGLALLRRGLDPDEIADILNMPLDEVLKLKNGV